MTDDLVQFLSARLDEDEEAARKAAELCGCHPDAPSWTYGDEATDGRIAVVDDPHPDVKRTLGKRWGGTYHGLFAAQHVVRHDPARVLREVDAKRRMIRLHACAEGHECSTVDDPCAWIMEGEACTTLRLLALSYADHPNYREEWRP